MARTNQSVAEQTRNERRLAKSKCNKQTARKESIIVRGRNLATGKGYGGWRQFTGDRKSSTGPPFIHSVL